MHIIPPPFLLVQVKAPATLIIYAPSYLDNMQVSSFLSPSSRQVSCESKSIWFPNFAKSKSAFQHEQSLVFQSPQTVNVTACFHHCLHGSLAELPSLVCSLLLAACFGLTTPTWCHTSEDLATIFRCEVDKARSACGLLPR